MNILIAEDTAVNAIMLRNMLAHEGYRILVAADGQEALRMLEAHPEVDLLATDLVMPGMDGFALLDEVRNRDTLRNLPVIIITGDAEADTVRRAVAMGARAYILKPLTEPSRVLEKVRQIAESMDPVLLDENSISEELPGSRRSYMEILDALSSSVSQALARGSLPDPESLRAFRDSAEKVGARRLLAALDAHLAGDGGNRDLTPVLLREFAALQAVLVQRGVDPPES